MEPGSKRAKFSPANWWDLPQELVTSIARCVGSPQDFVTFGAVCKSWSHAITKQDFRGGLTHQVPFLMLPHDTGNAPKWYNLSRGRFSGLHVNIPYNDYCRSSLGWLILQPQTRYTTKHSYMFPLPKENAYMFHPFNHTRIVLPFCGDSIKKFVLSSGTWFPSGYIAKISCIGRVAFWRPKDEEWTNISSFPYRRWPPGFDDIVFYRGQIYAVERVVFSGVIHVCDIDDHKTEARVVFLQKSELYLFHGGKRPEQLYLVESAGNLLLVSRYGQPGNKTVGFRVFKVPFDTEGWTKIENLGNRALFLGDNSSSFSVEISSDYPGCKANCIYFTTEIEMRDGHIKPPPQCGVFDMDVKPPPPPQCGVFDMDDGQVKQLLDESASFVGRYIWIQPSF